VDGPLRPRQLIACKFGPSSKENQTIRKGESQKALERYWDKPEWLGLRQKKTTKSSTKERQNWKRRGGAWVSATRFTSPGEGRETKKRNHSRFKRKTNAHKRHLGLKQEERVGIQKSHSIRHNPLKKRQNWHREAGALDIKLGEIN